MRTHIAAALAVYAAGCLTAAAVEHPFILWTRDEAAALRKKIETDPWAKKAYEDMLKTGGRGGTFRNLFRYNVMDDTKAGESEKNYLMGIVGTHPRQFEKMESGGRHYDCYLDVLRYDSLYDMLAKEEREKVEATFREYVAYQLTDTKEYTRTSWLPNMQWPRPMTAFMMAMALQDKELIDKTWNSRCGFKWYMDEYVADGCFYMEEFGKQYSMIGEMLLYCRGLKNIGMDELGYGYRGKGGATMRSYVESIIKAGYPRIDLGTARAHYGKVTMGDARGSGPEGTPSYAFQHTIVAGFFPNGKGGDDYWCGANMNGRDHKNTKVEKLSTPHWFEIAHALWPDAGFNYFLAQMRKPADDKYYPSLFWGLDPIDPAAVKAPPAPSYVAPERGFAFLRAEESPAYWESPAPAVALQLGQYYVHYTHDCFSLLGFVCFNRPIYFNRGIADGYAGGDPWTDSGRGHSGPVVDGLQPKPVGQLPVRSSFDPLVKFAAVTDDPAARTAAAADASNKDVKDTTVFPGVHLLRALFLTREYLLDVLRFSSDSPHEYDWHAHALGLPDPQGRGWKPSKDLDGGKLYERLPTNMAAKAAGDTERYDLKDVVALKADDTAWEARALQKCALPEGASNIMGSAWYDRGIGVSVRMLPEPGTTAYLGRSAEYIKREGKEPGKGARADTPNEIGGTTLLVRRTAPSTAFVALHEPFEKGSPRVTSFTRIAQDSNGVAVAVTGGGVNDRVFLQYGPGITTTLTLEGGGESFTFTDRGFVRIAKDRVTVTGPVTAFRVKVEGSPALTLNGRDAKASLADGCMVYGAQ